LEAVHTLDNIAEGVCHGDTVANVMLAAHTKQMIAAAAAGTIFTSRNCSQF
jgi:predicted deacylase